MSRSDDTAADPGTDNVLFATGSIDPQRPQTEFRFGDGQVLRIPTSLLFGRDAHSFASPEGQMEAFGEHASKSTKEDEVRIPVIEEVLEVGKRTVVTGTVLLEKQVYEYNEDLDLPLAVRTFDIERVVLNEIVDTAPPIRQEGETTVYPMVEEQLVLTKQLVLKEEMRVTRRDTERRDTRTITLRRETMQVTRTPKNPIHPTIADPVRD